MARLGGLCIVDNANLCYNRAFIGDLEFVCRIF